MCIRVCSRTCLRVQCRGLNNDDLDNVPVPHSHHRVNGFTCLKCAST